MELNYLTMLPPLSSKSPSIFSEVGYPPAWTRREHFGRLWTEMWSSERTVYGECHGQTVYPNGRLDHGHNLRLCGPLLFASAFY